MNMETAETCAKYLQAVGEPTRLRIVDLLRSGTMSVGDIATKLNLEIVNTSHHLRVLSNAGILVSKKRNRFVDYSLNMKLFKLDDKRQLVADFIWCTLKTSG